MIPNFEKLRVIEFPGCNVSAFHRVLAKSLTRETILVSVSSLLMNELFARNLSTRYTFLGDP